jgi:hypothetical protein
LREENTSSNWKDTTAKYDRAPFEAAEEIERLRLLLLQGSKQLHAWHAKYGDNQPEWLPPAGDVQWLENVNDILQEM